MFCAIVLNDHNSGVRWIPNELFKKTHHTEIHRLVVDFLSLLYEVDFFLYSRGEHPSKLTKVYLQISSGYRLHWIAYTCLLWTFEVSRREFPMKVQKVCEIGKEFVEFAMLCVMFLGWQSGELMRKWVYARDRLHEGSQHRWIVARVAGVARDRVLIVFGGKREAMFAGNFKATQ